LLAISRGVCDATRPGEDAGLRRWCGELRDLPGVALLLREKHLADRALFEASRMVRRLFPGTLLISGRPDVAATVGAAGVHLPAAGLPVAAVRRRFPELLVGVSTHTLEEVAEARGGGAHFAMLAPIFETPGKLADDPRLSLGRLQAAAALGLPIVALGGIDADRVPVVLAAGASGVAGIRCFGDGATAAGMTQAFLRARAAMTLR
jgi:thiamine-phosphate pyrophosphorylase